MTKNDALMERARRLDPKPVNRFNGFADSPEAREMLEEILQTPVEIQSTRRRPRRSIATLVAAAVLASAGAVAAGVAMSRPDKKQSAQVERDFSEQATMHLDGWRPELAAESVFCLIPGSDQLVTYASDFPLRERLNSDKLVQACAEGSASRSDDEPVSTDPPTLCVSEKKAPLAIVGVGGIDCSTMAVADGSDGSGVEARPIRPEDLDELNLMRAVEVAVLAVPTEDGCPTSEEATTWTEAQLEKSGLGELQINVSDEGDGCYRGRIRWDTDFHFDGGGGVLIGKFGNQP